MNQPTNKPCNLIQEIDTLIVRFGIYVEILKNSKKCLKIVKCCQPGPNSMQETNNLCYYQHTLFSRSFFELLPERNCCRESYTKCWNASEPVHYEKVTWACQSIFKINFLLNIHNFFINKLKLFLAFVIFFAVCVHF